MSKYIYRIGTQGNQVFIEGLWSDALAGLGNSEVKRASRVEYNEDLQRWTVTLLLGPYGDACLLETFPKRKDALDAERDTLNVWMQAQAQGLS